MNDLYFKKSILTCPPFAVAMASAEDHPVDQEEEAMATACSYAEQSKRVRSVIRCREDSCDVIISVAHFSDDVGEHDFVASVDGNHSSQLRIERDV